MPYAVEIFPDTDSESSIRAIWECLSNHCISPYIQQSGSTPHITLGIFNNIDVEIFNKRLKEVADHTAAFDLVLTSIGTFPTDVGAVFLAPVVTQELLELHKCFNDVFVDFMDEQWEYYLPGNWVPHCTVAIDIEKSKVVKAIGCLIESFKPLKIHMDRIGIVEFKPVRHLSSFKLKDSNVI